VSYRRRFRRRKQVGHPTPFGIALREASDARIVSSLWNGSMPIARSSEEAFLHRVMYGASVQWVNGSLAVST
jgi:hypothetical protein